MEKISKETTMVLSAIVGSFIVLASGIGMIIAVVNQDDCPDCNVEFPIVSDCETHELTREQDFIDVHYSDTHFFIVYYDNYDDEYDQTPSFTIENWTEALDWTKEKGEDVFSLKQRQTILLIVTNMAYYKETGTWLGE